METPDRESFIESIDKEQNCMANHEFFKNFSCKNVTKQNKGLHSKWVNKFKLNDDGHCQLGNKEILTNWWSWSQFEPYILSDWLWENNTCDVIFIGNG